MKQPWSISTTVRNPYRLRDLLRILATMEGEPFNQENQVKYQILLIKEKLYQPTELTDDQKEYFTEVEKEMPFSVAEEIFRTQNYVEPAMRGRTSVAPLNKMGLCVAKSSGEQIKITDLGRYFLSDDYNLRRLFFLYFLKWQLPNPSDKSFPAKNGFNIKPFVGILHLIDQVNKKWAQLGEEPVGISKEEFGLFALTLIDYKEISTQAKRIVEFRNGIRSCKSKDDKERFRKEYIKELLKEFLKDDTDYSLVRLVKTLHDYGDNAIRYLRLTSYVYIRGNGHYVDLEHRRMVEIRALLDYDNAEPLVFTSQDSYLSYLSDLQQPILPWETVRELKKIIDISVSEIEEIKKVLNEKKLSYADFAYRETETLSVEELKKYVEQLRQYRADLQNVVLRFEAQSLEKIEEYIAGLGSIYQSGRRSIELEHLVTLALNALNDALKIQPNYPVGDDNEPTFTAPAGKPDIECFYGEFNSICEVTMLSDRSQWYNEGQPVMRHLRDFERKNNEKDAYCLFVAPKIHIDTAETFWVAIKHGYKGEQQKIIPLSISQLIQILKVLVRIKQKDEKFSHQSLYELYKSILGIADQVANSDEWIREIPREIAAWERKMIS